MKVIAFLVLTFLTLVCLITNGSGYTVSRVKMNKFSAGENNEPLALKLLEGPHWDAERQELLYVDIENKEIHRFVPETEQFFTCKINAGRVSLIVPVRGQLNKYIIGVERNLMMMEWDGRSTEPNRLVLHKTLNAEGSLRSRSNDGKCDPRGRLWAGTMDETGQSNGNLYKLDIDDTLSQRVGRVGTSNGLAWSLDNRTMYYIDTNTGKVDAFDYEISAGVIANRRTIFDVWASGVGGSPDGMTIDSAGNLWVATWGGSKVLHINPREGRLIGVIDLTGTASQITSVAFGGYNLETLYITTADSGNPDEVGGNLFEVSDTGATGVSGGVSFCLNCA